MITISDILLVIKKQILVLTCIVIFGTSILYGIQKVNQKETYVTQATVLIKGSKGLEYANIQATQATMNIYDGIINTEDFVEKALKKAQLNINPNSVLSSLKVQIEKEQQTIKLIMYTSSQYEGKKVIDALYEQLISATQEYAPSQEIIMINKPKVPENPVDYNNKSILIFSLIISFSIGIIIIFLLENFNSKIKFEDEIEKYLELQVLGTIPYSLEIRRSEKIDAF